MNLIDKLLQIDKKKITEKREKTYESGRMQELTGDSKILIREIDPERLSELQCSAVDGETGTADFSKMYGVNLLITTEGVVNPDLRNKDLQQHFGAASPKDLAKLLFKSEVMEIADAISELGAPKVNAETIKN